MLSRGQPRRFWRSRASSAALEFALVLPLMLALLAGVYDLSEAAIIRAEVYNAAQVMSASGSALAVQKDGSTALTWAQVEQTESAIWAMVPSMRDGQKSGSPKSITMTSIQFFPNLATSCGYHQPTPCQFNADVVWSIAYVPPATSGATFQTVLPSNCQTVYNAGQSAADQVSATVNLVGTDNVSKFRTYDIATSTAMADGYPANEAGVPPILAVTVQFTYTPLFNLFILQPYTFWVDGYWPVRSVKATTSSPFLNDLVPPLSKQYTTLIGTPPTTLSGSPAPTPGSYCLNAGTGPVSSPVSGT
jgi:Flp pilus assembly protein TadG